MTPPLDTIVRGGTLVEADGTRRADIGIADGRIVVVAESIDAPAGRIIDATGRYVLPGGVDVHAHLDQVSAKGSRTADDFHTGTRSAAHGGTTTVLAFAAQAKGEPLCDVVVRGLESASRSATNAGVHLIVTDISVPDAMEGLRLAAESGIGSLKVFTTYERLRLADAELVTALAAARDLGLTVMVHAEHHGLIAYETGRLVEAGRHAPDSHLRAHTRHAEAAGVAEIAQLAEYLDMPIYLVHLSSAKALETVWSARARGVRLIAETCPHYLFLDETRLSQPLRLAVQSMCSPPLRDGPDRDALWAALASGAIDVIGSDHAPYRLDTAKLPRGDDTSFTECANGIPGVELRMPLLVSEALTAGRLSLSDVVRLCCTRPAQVMGLHPRKGTLAVGADADIAVWDPAARWTVHIDELHDNMDHTPYDGTRLTGRVDIVLDAGVVVVDRTGDRAEPLVAGRGRYVARPVVARRDARPTADPAVLVAR